MQRKQIYGIIASVILLLWAILPFVFGDSVGRINIFRHTLIESIVILKIGAASLILSIKKIYKPLIILGIISAILTLLRLYTGSMELEHLSQAGFDSGSGADEAAAKLDEMRVKYSHQWGWIFILFAIWTLIAVGIMRDKPSPTKS